MTPRDYRKGFTLIEILTVLFILSVLSLVVVTSLSAARMKSRDSARVSDIGALRLALEQYYDACGQYPNVITSLSYNAGCSGTTNFGSFLGQLKTDPTNSGSYTYRYYAEAPAGNLTKCLAYHIGARLEGTNTALSQDSDVSDSASISTLTTQCTGSGAAFDGVDDTLGGGTGIDIMFDGTSNL